MDETQEPPAGQPQSGNWNPLRWPLYLRVLLGVAIGTAIGLLFGGREIAFGWTTAHLGQIAGLYIQLLTALATPLIFFAIVEAFVRTNITGRQGLRMFVVCAINIAVAFFIGLTILNVWQPGRSWHGKLRPVDASAATDGTQAANLPTLDEQAKKASLSPLEIVRSYVPRSVGQPFTENMVLTVAVMAILIGAALRALKRSADAELQPALATFEQLIVASYKIILKLLMWIIELAPWAICLAVAGVIGSAGLATFGLVGIFFLTATTALALHALLYYPLSAWLVGGKSPVRYFREGINAILTGFSLNSSLATAPLTLEALRRLEVSDSSARLSACVGTNFNNDGITLYEALTALFIAQAAGMELGIGQQITILLAALAGSMGIAGIPNSGLIILTLVLKAARLPDDIVALALPIVYSIDFIIARLRSAVNVMGDMQVAILLDVGNPPDAVAGSADA
jgi:DAACS family dicarboxylate/amino acid:cation (Na+ or H+) symporter